MLSVNRISDYQLFFSPSNIKVPSIMTFLQDKKITTFCRIFVYFIIDPYKLCEILDLTYKV